MAHINYVNKKIAIKIVYYGPGLSGKTTNLRYIYSNIEDQSRGELISLETATERTYFFDLLPIKAGLIEDFTVHFQLLTVPGQIFYEAARKSVLKGVDGIVFVADSQISLLDANVESFEGLKKNLENHRLNYDRIPLVLQYNKRDLEYIVPVEGFNELFNEREVPFVEASAINGAGVFETLKEIAKVTVPEVREQVYEEGVGAGIEDRASPLDSDPESIREDRGDEVEFVAEAQAKPFRLTKLKLDSLEDVEKEVDHLAEELTENQEK